MKKKFYLLYAFVFFSLGLNAQTPIQATIGGPSTIAICSDNNLFQVDFSNLPTNSFVTLDIEFTISSGPLITNVLPLPAWPDCIDGPIVNGNNPILPYPDLTTLQNITSPAFTFLSASNGSGIQLFQLSFNTGSQTICHMEFFVPIDCSLIPVLPVQPGNSQYHLHQVWKKNNVMVSVPNTLTSPIIYPYITFPNTLSINGNYYQAVPVYLYYQNTGNADADIDFSFNDLYIGPCGNNAAYKPAKTG